MSVSDILYWVSFAILWFSIGLNWWCIIINSQNRKKLKEAILKLECEITECETLREKYLERLRMIGVDSGDENRKD